MELTTRYYAQLADGIVVAVSQLARSVDAPEMIELESYDTTVLGMRYVPASGAFEVLPPVVAPAARSVSVKGFRFRFTPAEKAAIEWAAVDRPDQPDAQRMQAAALRSDLKDQAQATYIDLDAPDVLDGVQTLEAMAILAPGRALEILTAPVQPKELP